MMNLATYLDQTDTTQADFAEAVGISQGAVSKLCAFGQPSLKTAMRIEKATRGLVPLEAWSAFAALADRPKPKRKAV